MIITCKFALKKQLRAALSILLLTGGLLIMGSCAGGSISKVGGDNAMPTELSKEDRDRFEVKDSGTNAKPAFVVGEQARQGALQVKEKTKETSTPAKDKKSKKTGKTVVTPVAAVALASTSIPAAVDKTTVNKAGRYPKRRPVKDPIWLNEKMTFEATYFGVPAGELTIETLPYKTVNGRKVYHFSGIATSAKFFSMFYKVHDTVESFMDYESLFSYRLHMVLDETKQTRDSLELYDPDKLQSFFWNRWNHWKKGYVEVKQTISIRPLSQDTFSALMYLRTFSYSPGTVVVVPIVSEGKTWDGIATFVRKEMLATPMGKVQTIVLKLDTKFQGVLQRRGDSFLWLTDDDRKIPVRLEAKVKIGTVIAVLKKMERGTPPQ